MKKTYGWLVPWPSTMVILLARVIADRTMWTRLATGRCRFSQGHEAWLGLPVRLARPAWLVRLAWLVFAAAVEVDTAKARGTHAVSALSTSKAFGIPRA